MDPFFMYVSIGALVILILILVLVGVSLSKVKSLVPFPPTQNACPDYWDVSANPNYCGVPVDSNMKNFGHIIANVNNGVDINNSQNVGMCKNVDVKKFGCGANVFGPLSTVSPSKFQYVQLSNNSKWSKLYPGLTERCAQKKWANMMDVEWDGVTNYNGC